MGLAPGLAVGLATFLVNIPDQADGPGHALGGNAGPFPENQPEGLNGLNGVYGNH